MSEMLSFFFFRDICILVVTFIIFVYPNINIRTSLFVYMYWFETQSVLFKCQEIRCTIVSREQHNLKAFIFTPHILCKKQVSYFTVTKALRQTMLSSNYLPNLIPFHQPVHPCNDRKTLLSNQTQTKCLPN